jgi:plasmid replication initiation protein
MSEAKTFPSERDQLELFRALPGDLAPRDAQDLMAYPFFSLSKSHRVIPIDFRMGEVTIRVDTAEHGMATIWDAGVLIWAASQLVEARDRGLRTSQLMTATPYDLLTSIRRGTSAHDDHRLKAALDRLQSTRVATTLRQPSARRPHRFAWVNEWKACADSNGHSPGIELIIPKWFYAAVLNDALVLTIKRAYFQLAGGLERWLYRIVRKHAGRQPGGWCFEIAHLHLKSGSLAPLKRFAFELRSIARRQPLPGFRLAMEVSPFGRHLLTFRPAASNSGMPILRARQLSTRPVDKSRDKL